MILYAGLSTGWGQSTVVLYQNEINSLQEMAERTLSMVDVPSSRPDSPDLVCISSMTADH